MAFFKKKKKSQFDFGPVSLLCHIDDLRHTLSLEISILWFSERGALSLCSQTMWSLLHSVWLFTTPHSW